MLDKSKKYIIIISRGGRRGNNSPLLPSDNTKQERSCLKMSIYKASNLQPHLQEVDVEQNNTFSCQVNTSGTPVYAYKMDILSIDGEKEIYKGNAVELATPIENKEFLDIPNINKQATFMHDLYNCKYY